MELIRTSNAKVTLWNTDENAVYHIAVEYNGTAVCTRDELRPKQKVELTIPPLSQEPPTTVRVTWETHLGEKQVSEQTLH